MCSISQSVFHVIVCDRFHVRFSVVFVFVVVCVLFFVFECVRVLVISFVSVFVFVYNCVCVLVLVLPKRSAKQISIGVTHLLK